MAKPNNNRNSKSSSPSKFAPIAKKPIAKPASGVAGRTEVRNSAIPKPSTKPAAAGPKVAITHELIARRAYEIHLSGSGGSQFDNWIRAERELRDRK